VYEEEEEEEEDGLSEILLSNASKSARSRPRGREGGTRRRRLGVDGAMMLRVVG
jgi:hypothetical protein